MFDLESFMMVIYAGAIGVALYYLIKAYVCKHWPSVEGKIVLSKGRCSIPGDWGDRAPFPDIFYGANIKYVFSINGIEYTGSKIFLNDGGSPSATQAHSLLNKYPNGKQAMVHYNPSNPKDCVLEVDQPAEYFLWCYGALVVCSVLLVMFSKS